MKKIIYSMLVIWIFVFVSGCERELTSEGVSRITYYVIFSLTDGPLVLNPKGTAFVDPGYVAMEGTTDVTNQVIVTGSVDANQVGMYELTYSATNTEGFHSSVTRTVIVYDPAIATDLSGEYLSDVARVSPSRHFTGLSVTISKIAPGIFRISDLLGGFYDQGSNYRYGPAYAMSGYLQLNSDNTLTYLSSYMPGFGDSLNSFSNGVYDPDTKGISWQVTYTTSNYLYLVTLTVI